MYRQCLAVAAAIALGLSGSTVRAQCACGPAETTYAPVVANYVTYAAPTVTYYAPAQETAYYAPAVPQVTYYAPAVPQVSYYAPTVPQVTYYAPAVPQVTYYAPIAQPSVVYYGTLGSSIFGSPRVYVPGEPVRNVLRAITP